MIQRLLQRLRLTAKAQSSPRKWIDAAFPAHQQHNQHQRVNPEQWELINRYTGYVSICADAVATACAGSTLRLYRVSRKNGISRARKAWLSDPRGAGTRSARIASGSLGIEEIEDHPALDLIADPNQYDQGNSYWHVHYVRLLITGNSYHHPVMRGGRISGLFDLMPQYVTIVPSETDLVDHYTYGLKGSEIVRLPPDEVLHMKLQKSPWSNLYGVGKLYKILPEHDIRVAMNVYQKSLMEKAATPTMAFMLEPGTYGPDEIERVQKKIESSYAGTWNAGKSLILANMKVQTLSQTLRDMDYHNGRMKLESDIAAAFGVPESILRMNDANLASSQTGNIQFLRGTVNPILVQQCNWLTETVLPEFGLDPSDYWFAPDNPAPEDEDRIAARNVSLVSGGLKTINEAREEFGLEPVEGGDVIRFGGRSVETLDASPTDPFAGFFGARRVVFDQDEPPEDEISVTPKLIVQPAEVVKNSTCSHAKHVKQSELWSKAVDHDHFGLEASEAFVADVSAFFAAQRDSILAAIEANPSGKQWAGYAVKSVEDEVARLLRAWGVSDLERWDSALRDAAVSHVRAAMLERMREAFVAIAESDPSAGQPPDFSIDPRFDLENPGALDLIRSAGENFKRGVSSVNQTTADTLGRALAEGVKAGETSDKLARRIRATFDGETPSGDTYSLARARSFARTETARAVTNAQYAGAEATGVVEGKYWLLSPAACEFCTAAAAEFGDPSKAIPISRPFYPIGSTVTGILGGTLDVDFADGEPGSLHPNCRCAPLFVLNGGGTAGLPIVENAE